MKNRKFLLSFFAFTSLCIVVNSQIFYQDIDPDIVIDTWDVHQVHIDSSATATLPYGAPGSLSIWQEFGTQIAINAFSDCNVMMDGGYPAALDYDDPIEPTATWVIPDYSILNNGTQGNWIGVADKYLGVKVFNGSTWLYGWIRLDVNATGNSVTIKDYACNRYPNQPIKAGQTTTTIIHEAILQEPVHMSAYPNPFSHFTIISTNEYFKNSSMDIFNLHGQKVKTISGILGSEFKLYRDDLPGGVYLLQLSEGTTSAISKIIIID